MIYYSCTNPNFKICGLPYSKPEKRKFYRLPNSMIKKRPQYEFLGKRSVGGRIRFCTDSSKISVRYKLESISPDIYIPLSGSAGMDIYYGKGNEAVFGGSIAPDRYSKSKVTIEKTFERIPIMETITLNLPRNEILLDLEIGLEDDSSLEVAEEYSISDPIIFYGSSITEGGCAPRPGISYTSLMCRWLDADYINYGFSGAAKGELSFAKFIAEHKKISLFIYDYDHNSPSLDHLSKTHEPFFKLIREYHPNLPIIILSRPDVDTDLIESKLRSGIIYNTYENARNSGDKNTFFLDGSLFFGKEGRSECTVDGCHPNALGFRRMAEQIYPLAKRLLADSYRKS